MNYLADSNQSLHALTFSYWKQGCKRDLFFRDRDVWKFVQDKTETIQIRPRDVSRLRHRDQDFIPVIIQRTNATAA